MRCGSSSHNTRCSVTEDFAKLTYVRYFSLLALGSLTLLSACSRNLSANVTEFPPDAKTVDLYYYVSQEPGEATVGPLVGVQSMGGTFYACASEFIPVKVQVPGVAFFLDEAMNAFVSRGDETFTENGRELHNAGAKYGLTFDSTELRGESVTVNLTSTRGASDSHMEVPCDDALLYRQIELMMKQFPNIDDVNVLLNGIPIRADIEG